MNHQDAGWQAGSESEAGCWGAMRQRCSSCCARGEWRLHAHCCHGECDRRNYADGVLSLQDEPQTLLLEDYHEQSSQRLKS